MTVKLTARFKSNRELLERDNFSDIENENDRETVAENYVALMEEELSNTLIDLAKASRFDQNELEYEVIPESTFSDWEGGRFSRNTGLIECGADIRYSVDCDANERLDLEDEAQENLSEDVEVLTLLFERLIGIHLQESEKIAERKARASIEEGDRS